MIKNFLNHKPVLHDSCFIAETASVIGRVTVAENASIWFGAVIRSDENNTHIGKGTNIQDNAVIHQSDVYPCIIGDNVTVGHNAIVHACTVGNNVLIGMGATILDGAVIGDDCIIGAHALVTGGKKIPSGSMVMGMPAKVVRALTDEEIQSIHDSAVAYQAKAKQYK